MPKDICSNFNFIYGNTFLTKLQNDTRLKHIFILINLDTHIFNNTIHSIQIVFMLTFQSEYSFFFLQFNPLRPAITQYSVVEDFRILTIPYVHGVKKQDVLLVVSGSWIMDHTSLLLAVPLSFFIFRFYRKYVCIIIIGKY